MRKKYKFDRPFIRAEVSFVKYMNSEYADNEENVLPIDCNKCNS